MNPPLDEYRKKRDFGKTPEPAGEVRPGQGGPLFVVHRHEARRLHYDLRLEMDGVLRSWAVPRGLSYDPDDKRLAVHTEDHPIAYLDFHGVIPKGEYGAGSMTIWDRGRYRLLDFTDWAAADKKGKVEFILYGRRFRGEWHLVKTRANDGKDWLLFKSRDRYARDPDDASTDFDLSAAVEAPLPATAEVMRAGGTAAAFSDPEWLFEMKFAGRRVLARVDGEAITLLEPSGQPLGLDPPEVTRDLARIRAETALLDGVLVALDEGGRPSLQLLEARLAGDAEVEVYFNAFDLLHYDEWDLRPLPLIERKAVLSSVVPKARHVLHVDHVAASGEKLVAAVTRAGLTGAIAKRATSDYRAGPSSDWLEIPVDTPETAKDLGFREALTAGGGEAATRDARVNYTNLDKVFWPEDGYTKGDLIAYYEQVADFLVPYLEERPLHLNRFPDGIHGKSFYQRDARPHLQDWIETELITHDSDKQAAPHVICGDRATLLYLANLGSIDLHPWLSRRPHLDQPDWAVIDLDPKQAPFGHVVRIARTLGHLLEAVEIPAYVKTSGSTGLHIYIPLDEGYTYDHSRMFCEVLARFAHREHKDISTLERGISRRGSKVYIDYLQNRKSQTVVPPYVVRPVPGATVSTPLEWEELTPELTISQFTIRTVGPRLARVGDLFRPTLTGGIDLLEAIAALQRYMDES